MKRPVIDPAVLGILAGVCAALHVGKLPPALPVLRDALGVSLLQAGFLLSMVQLAGMSLGLAIGFLLIVLGHTDYLRPELPSEEAQRMVALVTGYSKWSFSLGAVAAFATMWLVFRRWGYNVAELLTLALYCKAVFIALQMVNQLPLVLASSPELFRWHKAWSPWYMTALQTLMLMVALRQFLVLDWRRDGWRLLLAGALFAALKWQATQLYAREVVELVLWQMGA